MFGIYIFGFILLSLTPIMFPFAVEKDSFWEAVKIAPMIFGTLTFIVMGISLSYFSFKAFSKVICFTAVVTDATNKKLVNSLLVNMFILNFLASLMIAGYIGLYFASTFSLVHVINIALSSFIFPMIYCLRILEGCIDKIVNLETHIEETCMKYINPILTRNLP